jgi:hypothetical protein
MKDVCIEFFEKKSFVKKEISKSKKSKKFYNDILLI